MPIRMIKQPILVVRDGKQVQPEIGKEFDLTASELSEINKLNPAALDVVETVDAPVVATKAKT